MSLEITLYPKSTTKNKLVNLIKEQGFRKSEHLLDYLDGKDKNRLHFGWFGIKNYESFAGVEVTILKATKNEIEEYSCTNWILHTRTKSHGSRIDKSKQNELIRKARKLFGGTFYNDWYGTNRYTKLDDYDKMSAPERGLCLMYENLYNKLWRLKNCLISYENPLSNTFLSMGNDKFSTEIKKHDPSIILYNSMLPFIVSLIEYFFKETFEVLIKYDENAKEVIENENTKISLKDIVAIKEGYLSVESVISKNYTFQNLKHINSSFMKYLSIDMFKLLSKKKKVGNRIFRLKEKLEEIIIKRHQMIHHFSFDSSLTKKEIIEMLDVVEVTVKIVLKSIEKERGWNLEEI